MVRMNQVDDGLQSIQQALDAGYDPSMAARELGEAGHAELAVALLRGALNQQPNNLVLILALAFELSASPQEDVRDGAEALRLTEPLLMQGAGGLRAYEVRACAFAEVGRFADAVEMMDHALLIARQGAPQILLEQLQSKRELFRGHQPYRYESGVSTPPVP
jgi:hypothetical protein